MYINMYIQLLCILIGFTSLLLCCGGGGGLVCFVVSVCPWQSGWMRMGADTRNNMGESNGERAKGENKTKQQDMQSTHCLILTAREIIIVVQVP